MNGCWKVRAIFPVLLAVVMGLVAAVVRAGIADDADGPETVVLPIEVIGDPVAGYETSITVSTASHGRFLYLRLHNPGYTRIHTAGVDGGKISTDRHVDNKAAVSVDAGSTFTPISNANCSFPAPESSIGYSETYDGGSLAGQPIISGPIGSFFRVVRCTLDLGTIPSSPTIVFRFNGQDPVTSLGATSSGYRVLELDVLDANGETVVSGTSFVEDDPDSWSPPPQASAANGESLWATRNILTEGDSSRSIIASCADCHATDGRDLAYFNFSNHSIIERSRFHGLTQQQGEDISAYIRSLSLDLPVGYSRGDLGRPWDPPYQPGPGLLSQPVELWAAGAGFEWARIEDSESTKIMFPGSVSESILADLSGVLSSSALASMDSEVTVDSVKSVADPDAFINVIEIPVGAPLPDIFEWWPDIHPIDYLAVTNPDPIAEYESGFFKQRFDVWEAGVDTPDELVSAIARSRDEYADGDDFDEPDGVYNYDRKATRPWTFETWNWPNSYQSNSSTQFDLVAAQSFEQWRLMKAWTIRQKYKLEGLPREVWPDPLAIDYGNGPEWGWFSASAHYDLAPHKNVKTSTLYYPEHGAYATECENAIFSSIWYEFAAIVGHGFQITQGNSPYDWNYQHPHIADFQLCSGLSQSWRYIKSQIQVMQVWADGDGLSGGSSGDGWQHQSGGGVNINRLGRNAKPGIVLASLSQTQWRTILAGFMSGWIQETYKHEASWGNFDLSLPYWRAAGEMPVLVDVDEVGFGYPSKTDVLFTWTDEIAAIGDAASGLLADSIARFGNSLWPAGDWEQWYCGGSSSPGCQIEGPIYSDRFER